LQAVGGGPAALSISGSKLISAPFFAFNRGDWGYRRVGVKDQRTLPGDQVVCWRYLGIAGSITSRAVW